MPNKKQLLAEYAAVTKLGQLEATQENVDSAIRYLHKLILRDLRPPWLTHRSRSPATTQAFASTRRPRS